MSDTTQMQASATVILTLDQWNVVGAALNELPRRVSDPVFTAIAQQIAQSQQTAPTVTPDMDEPKPAAAKKK